MEARDKVKGVQLDRTGKPSSQPIRVLLAGCRVGVNLMIM